MTEPAEPNIKDYREKELKAFVLGNVLLILLGCGVLPIDGSSIQDIVQDFVNSAVISVIGYVFVFIANEVIPDDVKYRIIWPIGGVPGNRIFTRIRDKDDDSRFSREDASEAYKDIYQRIGKETNRKRQAKLQNSSWYEIYRRYKSTTQILVANRDFLLCRDMTAMTVWIMVGYIMMLLYLQERPSANVLVFILVEFAAVRLSASNRGWRLVYNVIAMDIASSKA